MIHYSVAPRLQNIAEYQVAKKANPNLKAEDFANAKYLYYGNAQSLETMDLDAFAEHIAAHGCSYDAADVQAILKKAVACLREQLLAGKSVELGDLGSFRLTLESKGAEYMDEFTSNNIMKVNVVWSKGSKFNDLRKDATFHEVLTKGNTAETLAAAKRAAGSRPESEQPNANGQQPNANGQQQTANGEHTLTLNASPTNGGTVTGAGQYDSGSTVNIQATPASGYTFTRWSDGNTQASRTVTLSNDLTLTATFTASSSGSGSDASGGVEQG